MNFLPKTSSAIVLLVSDDREELYRKRTGGIYYRHGEGMVVVVVGCGKVLVAVVGRASNRAIFRA